MSAKRASVGGRRGVVLVHVLMSLTLMAWVATMMLQWVLNRHLAEKNAIEGNEDRAHMAALQAQIFSCLQDRFPNYPSGGVCSDPGLSGAGCLPARIEGRPYVYQFCPGSPPCRVVVNICRPTDPSCSAPPCT